MIDQPRLSELLRRWEELRQQGRTISPEELCADCPELLAEFRRQLQALVATASLRTPDKETPGAGSPEALAATLDPPEPPGTGQRGRTGGLTDTAGSSPPLRPAFQAGDEPVPGYHLVRQLGKGGFGEVWEATGPGGFQVAFKFVSLAGRAGEIEHKALMVIRNVRHPNLLTIFGVWQLKGWLAVGMELADRTLHDRLQEALRRSLPGIPRRELVRYVLDAATVIDYLNKPRHFLDGGKPVGIQHGDVKPQNIFLIGEGVKVGDFGLVRLLERAVVPHEGGLTRAYAAPEVFAGQMSRWSDQYALAVTYCLLRGGRLPFPGHDRGCPPDLTMLPDEEQSAVRQALDADPRRRWPSCRAFVKALTEAKRPANAAPPLLPPPAPPHVAIPAPTEPTELSPAVAVNEQPASLRGGKINDASPREDQGLVGKSPERYQIIKQLGRGAMGTVYLAQDTRLGRQVALKIRDFAASEQPEALQRFLREAHVAGRLDHPNICPIYDVGEDKGRSFVAMAYVEGRSLAEVLRSKEPLAPRRAIEILAKLAWALAEAHRRGVIHRDLKPSNVIIDQRGEPIIMDFGLTHHADPEMRMSTGGSVMGTPVYMAPEQVTGAVKEIGPATDQYSLGVSFYEMLTGRVPFEGRMAQILASILTKKPRPPRELRPDLDPTLEAICLKAMSANIADRFPSITDFAQALEKVLGSTDAPAPMPAMVMPVMASSPPPMPLAASSPPPKLAARTTMTLESAPNFPDVPSRGPAKARRGLAVVGGLLLLGLAGYGLSQIISPGILLTGLVVLLAGICWWKRSHIWSWVRFRMKHGLIGLEPESSPELLDARELLTRTELEVIPKLENASDRQELSGLCKVLREAIATGDRRRVEEASFPLNDRLLNYAYLGGDERPAETTTVPDAIANGELTAGDAVWSVAFSPDGRLALFGSMDGTICADDIGTGKRVHSFDGHTDGVTSIAVAAGGRQLLSGGLDGLVRLWDLSRGLELRRFEGHAGRVSRVALSADGRRAVSGGEDRTVRLWDTESGRELRLCEGHAGWVTGVAVSPDGRLIASCGDDGLVRLWDADTGGDRGRCEGHSGPVKSVAFSPSGSHLVSGGDDGTVRLWDVVGGREVWHFNGHTDWVRDVAFSPRGDRILTASDDETLRLLRADSGVEVACLQGPTASFLCVGFSPDGRRALSGSDDGRARLWNLRQELS